MANYNMNSREILCEDDLIFDKGLIVDDENGIIFPKASVDPKLLKLQKDVTEFVTSVILKHELDFFKLIRHEFPKKMEYLLSTTNQIIINMITEITNNFYNNIYFDIQNEKNTSLAILILEMTKFSDYGPHILLDKLIRITFDAHIDINREKISIENIDIYNKCILSELNKYLLNCNLLHILSKGPDDDIMFKKIPDNEKPFNIVIDKNIEV